MTHETHTPKPKYENCIVAFLDILGFKKKVLNNQISSDTLKKIIRSLNIINTIPPGGKKVISDSRGRRTIQIRSRFFSDSLVFFLKKESDDIAHLFFVIRYLQDQLWERGLCLRGSIVLGKMYWPTVDDKVTVGRGLIDAHNCESTIAIYPRIVVSEQLYDYIEQEKAPSDPFGSGTCTHLAKLILQDSDGVCFLDLLNPEVTRPVGEHLDHNKDDDTFSIRYVPENDTRHPEILGFVDKTIQENLEENKICKDDRIEQKYAWLQSYMDKYQSASP